MSKIRTSVSQFLYMVIVVKVVVRISWMLPVLKKRTLCMNNLMMNSLNTVFIRIKIWRNNRCATLRMTDLLLRFYLSNRRKVSLENKNLQAYFFVHFLMAMLKIDVIYITQLIWSLLATPAESEAPSAPISSS